MQSTQEIIPEKKVRKSKKALAEIVEQPLETIQEEPEVKPKVTRKRVTKKKEVESVSAPTPSVNVAEPKAPKKQSAWFQALKKWNQGRDKYSIPKKGTDEYAEIQKLMGGLSI